MRFSLYPHGTRQWFSALTRLFVLALVPGSVMFFFTRMPGSSYSDPLPPLTRQEHQTAKLLRYHVRTLALDIGPRNIQRPSSMSLTVDYLEEVLTDLGYTVRQQEFSAHAVTAVNLEVEIAGSLQPEEIVVV